jgi:hypothetical protein
MKNVVAKPSRIALGCALLGALTLGGLGCGSSGGGGSHMDAGTGSAGADATGTAGANAGTDGGMSGNGGGGMGGNDAGGMGGGGNGGAGMGGNGGAGMGGNDAGAGSGGTAGADAAAGNDGSAGADAAAGSDGSAGADAAADAAAGSDGGVSDASDAGDASDASDAPCTNACAVGTKQCGAGGIQTCAVGANGCTAWGTAAACGTNQTCTGASGSASCVCNVDPNCNSATDHACDTSGNLITCGTDANGCVVATSTAACPAHQTCTGSKPNAVCDCVTPPTDCAGGAGTTFCATSGSVSTCQSSTTNGKTCVYADTPVSCGAHQSCTTPSGGAAACTCNADPNGCTMTNTPGTICGAGNTSVSCAPDSNGCAVGTPTACNAHSTCNASTGMCQCNSTTCTAVGPNCDGNTVVTCSQDGACLYGSAVAATCSANQTCQGAAGAGSCVCNAAPTACTGGGAGSFCGAGNTLTTCVKGADTCVTVQSQAACGTHQTCGGTGNTQSCQCNAAPAGCTGNGSFCSGTGTQSTCAVDAQNCSYNANMDTACPMHQTCKGSTLGSTCTCDNTCTMAQASGAGTYCTGMKTVNSCANDGNGCFIAGAMATTCPGSQVCLGADGMGACQCIPAGVVAGTGCSTAGATLCAGNTVLLCTNDGVTSCNQWVAMTDCTMSGLVCGTKVGGGASACQCPAQSGTDFIVDPVAGTSATAGVFATGVDSPSECRFETLTTALGAATASGDRVVAKSAAPPVYFAAETFPLNVPAGVTVTTADAMLTPANYTIEFNGGTDDAVTLGNTSIIEGVTITQSGGNAAASAISIAGTGAVVDTVTLEGPLATGITILGSGTINAPTITGFTTGIASSGTGSVTNGTLDSNTTGMTVTGGALTVSGSVGTVVNGGAGNGVVVSGSGTLNGSSLLVEGMTGAGIAASGTATLNLTTGDEIGPNGGNGITLTGGTATLGGVNIHNNAVGIAQSAGTIGIGNGGTTLVQSNTGNGVTLTGGTLTVGTATIGTNGGDGVTVTGGATLISDTGAPYANNSGNGISSTGSTLTFNGAAATPIAITGNKADGIFISAGGMSNASYLTISGNGTGATKKSGLEIVGVGTAVGIGTASDAAVTISGNTLHGININGTGTGAAADIRQAHITGNGSDGVYVSLNGGTAANAASASLTGLTVSSNGANGVEIVHAPGVGQAGTSPGAAVMNMTGLTVTGNGTAGAAAGILFSGSVGPVVASLQTSKIQSNTGIGIAVANTGAVGAMAETIEGNDVSQNSSTGILFAGVMTLQGFSANTVHANVGDQISITSRQASNATYNFNNTSATPCDANRNQVYCYGSGTPGGVGTVGIRVSTATNVVVDAEHMSWRNASAPANSVDYVVGPGGTASLDATNYCTPVTTCP